MKNQSNAAQEPLQLLYRNGQPATSGQLLAPRFSDICLTRDSQARCDLALEEAKKMDHPIRNDQECNQCIEAHGSIDFMLSEIRKLEKNDRDPFTKVLAQISAAVEPVKTQLVALSGNLKRLISEYRQMVEEGKRREQERLEKAAEDKRNEAKYTNDPKRARQAKTEANQLEKEAKEVAPKPAKGADTVHYWEATISNRVHAAKLPEKIVIMDVDQTELNKHVKAQEHAGVKITANFMPGLRLELKTRMRFH